MGSYRGVAGEVVWRGVRHPSLDYCSLKREPRGWRFTGVLVAKLRKTPFAARYEILVDSKFKTLSLSIERLSAGRLTTRRVEFQDGAWLVDGKERPDLRECTDVDLEASPVTNTIPIRRVGLNTRERVVITAAWIRLPSLKVTRLNQSYERLGPKRYLYRSASGFTAELEVDDLGLVTRYGDVWKQVQ